MIAQSQLTGLQVSRERSAKASAGTPLGRAHIPCLQHDHRAAVLGAAVVAGGAARRTDGADRWPHCAPRCTGSGTGIATTSQSCSTTSSRSNRSRGCSSSGRVGRSRTCGHVATCHSAWSSRRSCSSRATNANRRTAHGAVAAVVQQRLTDAERLRDWVERLKPLRRAKEFRTPACGHQWRGAVPRRGRRQPCLHRVRGPATHPTAPAPRLADGRVRFTDCEWHLGEGQVLVLRGGRGFPHGVRPVHERHAASAQNHHFRSGCVVRCSSYEIRHEPDEVMTDLISLGVPRS